MDMDIVERLRTPQGNDLLVAHDAADEITRLRKIEAAAKKLIFAVDIDKCDIAYDELEELLK